MKYAYPETYTLTPTLINFIYGFLYDRDRAHDLAQDTLVKLFTHKNSYEPRAALSTWLFTIAGNLARTELRKLKRRKTKSFSQLSRDDYEFNLDRMNISEENEDISPVSKGERYASVYEINELRCIFCGYCEEACPVGAIVLSNEYEFCSDDRSKFLYEKGDFLVERNEDYPELKKPKLPT